MSTLGRNDRCPCGSGKKLKLCCGQRRGPSERELAKAFLAQQRKWAAQQIEGLDTEDLYDIYEEMLELPTIDVSLQVPLPRLASPAIEHLLTVFAEPDPDPDEATAALNAALPSVDTPERRAGLARAVLALMYQGRIDEHVAAVAVMKLGQPGSSFLKSSLGESAAVAAGTVHTPAGLLIAAS
jgi:hypothetical protein